MIDLRRFPEETRAAEAARLATEHARSPFDLEHRPLVRAMLVTLDDLRHRLFVTMHQSVVDGVSAYRIFPAELTTLYEAFCSGKPSPLLDMEFQYADFAYSDRQRVRGSAWNEQLAYWRQRLGNFQFHTWPCVQPEALAGSCGAIQNFTVSEALYRDLKELCNREGVTLFMVLLAGFAVLFSRYTEQKDIAVGTVTQSGRKYPQVQPLLGYFLNLVALRIDLSGDRTVREILQECREVTVGALANDDVPWEIVMEELNRGLDSHSHRRCFRRRLRWRLRSRNQVQDGIRHQWTWTADGQNGVCIWSSAKDRTVYSDELNTPRTFSPRRLSHVCCRNSYLCCKPWFAIHPNVCRRCQHASQRSSNEQDRLKRWY